MTDHHLPDLQRVIGEVAARHNILLKPDDAAFALVTINRLILEDAIDDLLEKFREILREFEAAAGQVQAKAGTLIAKDVKEAMAAIRGELAIDVAAAGKQAQALVDAVHRAHSKAVVEKWIAIGIVCAVTLFASGVLVGIVMKVK